jgi:CubicO group peptidase (beta-lactamase class C family)
VTGLLAGSRKRGQRLTGAASAFALLLVLAAPSTSPARSASGERSIGQSLDRLWPEGAGGTVLSARDGKLTACRGLGMADRRRHVKARCHTAYDVMSMTKQFTAAAILKLEMMGALGVSDPLSHHLGPVPADKEPITLHQLLTHSSGLRSSLGGDYEPVSREELVARALGSKLRSAPGARYRYSNAGYSLLAAVVEKASGMGYEEFLRKHLFLPAGMKHTGYVLPAWGRGRVAVEYDERGKPRGRPFEHPWADDGPYWNLRGNGGMLSTARDMFRWYLALRGDRVLNVEAKRKLFAPYVPETRSAVTHYGYGWVIARSEKLGRIAWHDGGNGWSFGLVARWINDDRMVFWVSNSAYRRGDWNLARRGSELTAALAGL